MSRRLRRKIVGSVHLFIVVVAGLWLVVAAPSQPVDETAVSNDTAVQLLVYPVIFKQQHGLYL